MEPKIIALSELIAIVVAAPQEIGDADQLLEFTDDLAGVLTKHFGGEPSRALDGLPVSDDSEETEVEPSIAIHWNNEVPCEGGVWDKYDSDISWKNA